MAKKKKIKNEDPSINFRLPEELKQTIYKKALENNKTVSNYLRDHLQEFIDGSLYQQEFESLKSDSIVNSTEFLQLITWLLFQNNNDQCTLPNSILNGYILTIKKLSGLLPKELEGEFDKVLADLIRVVNESGSYRSFYFCGNGFYAPTFDYDKLWSYISTLN